ncbi:hypothetical protein amyaer_4028 [Microcystis aeruginosa NIES-2481]|nr:hypothetical protein amyaer_4028 [Microcystis aeruginosa NIES-2481]
MSMVVLVSISVSGNDSNLISYQLSVISYQLSINLVLFVVH